MAGTNGKGSVSHIIASVLQQAGYRTGLFTSPHLQDFRERIRVDGEMIPKQKVVNFVDKHHGKMVELELSFFEMTAALAFDYFAQSDVEVAVIETGLGGRLDATNIIVPLVSVITNVGLDHTALLGDTLPKIAAEKAGIIKKSIPVVIGESDPRYNEVIEQTAAANKSKVIYAEQEFSCEPLPLRNRPPTLLHAPHPRQPQLRGRSRSGGQLPAPQHGHGSRNGRFPARGDAADHLPPRLPRRCARHGSQHLAHGAAGKSWANSRLRSATQATTPTASPTSPGSSKPRPTNNSTA